MGVRLYSVILLYFGLLQKQAAVHLLVRWNQHNLLHRCQRRHKQYCSL